MKIAALPVGYVNGNVQMKFIPTMKTEKECFQMNQNV